MNQPGLETVAGFETQFLGGVAQKQCDLIALLGHLGFIAALLGHFEELGEHRARHFTEPPHARVALGARKITADVMHLPQGMGRYGQAFRRHLHGRTVDEFLKLQGPIVEFDYSFAVLRGNDAGHGQGMIIQVL